MTQEDGLEEVTQSIYERLGFRNAAKCIWKSSNLLTFAYGISVYPSLLKRSKTIEDLLGLHEQKYKESLKFRLFRPKYHKMKEELRKYDIK